MFLKYFVATVKVSAVCCYYNVILCERWTLIDLKTKSGEQTGMGRVTCGEEYLQHEPLLSCQVLRPQRHLHISALIQLRNLQLQQDVMS